MFYTLSPFISKIIRNCNLNNTRLIYIELDDYQYLKKKMVGR
ncbi:unnamed protein product [marine sediment metagenome]|uniref:Uncharacterized protein n=1 Tax=marine sediment metagenome TaxID=412755 RepID=X1DV86_9ZZZZ